MPQLMQKKESSNNDPMKTLQSLIDMQKDNINPYQKGVDKALKQAGEQHALDAIQQGVPAEHIIEQSGLNNNDPMKVLASLLTVQGLNGGNQEQSPPVQNIQNPVQNNLDPLKKQALDIVQPQGFHPLGMLLNLAGNVTGMSAANQAINSVRLSNISQAQDIQSGIRSEDKQSLIRNRNLESALMEKQLSGEDTEKIYRDPITGQEVDPITAEEDMKKGLGIYQVNQKVSTRAGVVERPLNKVPNLTEQEKQYVNQARIIGNTLTSFESNLDNVYDKYGGGSWQTFQAQKLPYAVSSDKDVQNLKSDLVYLKAQIPFLRGGKQLTDTEAKRVDIMLDPFGKSKSTYKRDIARFQDEFLQGSELAKFGINAGLMKKLIKGNKNNTEVSNQDNSNAGGKTITLPSGKTITLGQ